MQVNQVYEIVNKLTDEYLGKSDIATEDLSNVVDVGTQLFGAASVDNYLKSLTDHIGRMALVIRKYSGSVPSVLMDGWEFGSVLEKITAELPKASKSETWDLTDGTSYGQDTFYKPQVSAKFYNKYTCFDIKLSIADRQVKSAFSSAEQLNAFFSMIYNAIDQAFTVALDTLIMSTINNMTAETLHSEFEDGDYTTKSGVRAINLLYEYNTEYGAALTAADCMHVPDFIRFAAVRMSETQERLGKMSTLFNVGGKTRFTPADRLHVVMLSALASRADVYLQSDTYHNELSKLPNAERVAYWQGSGEGYTLDSVSKIDVTTPDGNTVTTSGILAVMFDREALGVNCMNRRTTTHYNAAAEFDNVYYKMDAQYFNDTNENFVVFFVA